LTELERKQERTPVPADWTYAPAPEAQDIVTLREQYGHFVGGEWLEPKETYTTISPAT
jgi:aldehyde dehydrogenase (NAD+)